MHALSSFVHVVLEPVGTRYLHYGGILLADRYRGSSVPNVTDPPQRCTKQVVATGERIQSPTRKAQGMATGAYINQDDQGRSFGAIDHFEISCNTCRVSKDGSLHMARFGTVTTL